MKEENIATHSMVFIHNSHPSKVSIILNGQNSLPVVASLEDLTPDYQTSDPLELRKYVYDALGYDPMFAFEPKTIVIVEGKTDKDILTSFANTLGKPVNNRATMLIPLGDATRAKRYTPIIMYVQAGKKCLIVLDTDYKNPTEIKNEIIKQEEEFRKTVGSKVVLNDDNFYLYPEDVYSIEFYLLNAVAICKAAGRTDQKLEKINNEINLKMSDIRNKKLKPKAAIRDIWQDNGFGPYYEARTAVKISEFISKQHLDQYHEIEKLTNAMTA